MDILVEPEVPALFEDVLPLELLNMGPDAIKIILNNFCMRLPK